MHLVIPRAWSIRKPDLRHSVPQEPYASDNADPLCRPPIQVRSALFILVIELVLIVLGFSV